MDALGCFFLLCCVAAFFVAGAQRGFISIDCGLNDPASYIHPLDGLTYVSDNGFVDGGVNVQIEPGSLGNGADKVYHSVRSFPNYTRNCYQLPVIIGTKYFMWANFLYGNYDGLNEIPSFRLYLGADLWDTVVFADKDTPFSTELVVQAETRFLYVCLVNIGQGKPFISGLKLRPLPENLYSPANSSLSLALRTVKRVDVGGQEDTWTRYPNDRIDRIWESDYDGYGTPYNTSQPVAELGNFFFGLPSVVMQTAVYSPDEILVNWTGGVDGRFYLFLYFMDVWPSAGGSSRKMNVLKNGEEWADVEVYYLLTNVLFSARPISASQYSFSIQPENASDELGAVLNSFEVYQALTFNGSTTEDKDVMAITAMKEYYQLKKNWIADPCLPSPWDGLTCDEAASPRIVRLDLSNSELTGMISRHIVNLTNLKNLNLSTNNLHGSVPPFLQEMPHLVNIDLSSNNLSGPLPDTIREKMRSGKLTLRIDDNPQICLQDQCTQDQRSRASKSDLLHISVVISLVVLVSLIFM